MKSLILYWSAGGNTEKIAKTIRDTLAENDVSADFMQIKEDAEIELYDYDLVFFGAPSYQWIPPEPVRKFIKNTMNRYRKGVRPIARPNAAANSRSCSAHFPACIRATGKATPPASFMAQFWEHMGFFVLDEWYTPAFSRLGRRMQTRHARRYFGPAQRTGPRRYKKQNARSFAGLKFL
jgi:hypothetical protein